MEKYAVLGLYHYQFNHEHTTKRSVFKQYAKISIFQIVYKKRTEIQTFVNVNPWHDGSEEPRPTELVAAM